MNGTGNLDVNCANSVPRFELIDKDGNVRGPFKSAADAMSYATKRWPDQEQDPDHTGRGWDVQIAGSR